MSGARRRRISFISRNVISVPGSEEEGMIFACTDPACRYMAEGESGEYPVCPKCGGLMLNVPEEKLTGEQWADLGVFWSRQEEEDTGGRSLYCFQKATEAGNACGMTNLAIYQENGWGLEKDLSTAAWLYEQAAEDSVMCRRFVPAGPCVSSTVLERTGIPEEAFRYCYLTAAEVGFDRAQMKVGFCFETGFGTEKDEEQEFFWYQSAALQHFAPGETEVGRCYEFGKGVAADPGLLAASWYKKAAEQGYPDGECCYGVCLEQGVGVGKKTRRKPFSGIRRQLFTGMPQE